MWGIAVLALMVNKLPRSHAIQCKHQPFPPNTLSLFPASLLYAPITDREATQQHMVYDKLGQLEKARHLNIKGDVQTDQRLQYIERHKIAHDHQDTNYTFGKEKDSRD
ncbi:unnamed protein product [Sphenostylis stenocarpa]|uniref:Uncharacterized protein n=1 Tax=Sphenostylis stenocarpa TaxID=92480 RepID=A0AA86VFL5_9FABA|nr:unnamed protein product [Sphenostylis stenocarpa]